MVGDAQRHHWKVLHCDLVWQNMTGMKQTAVFTSHATKSPFFHWQVGPLAYKKTILISFKLLEDLWFALYSSEYRVKLGLSAARKTFEVLEGFICTSQFCLQ